MNTPPPHPGQSGPKGLSVAPARILVVDDQPVNIQLVGCVLGKFGHEIVPASDGPTALRRLALRPVDLIILDLLMPGMDGREVCRRVQANPEWKDIPIIFLSAEDDKKDVVQALEAGGVDYITKTFNERELVSRVHTQLALKSARDRLRQLVEDKDELLGILAHDLSNHLVGIQASADVLQHRMARRGDSEQAKLCGNIWDTTGQLLAFVKGFLANSAAENGFSLQHESVSLSKLVARVVRDHRETAARKHMEIRVSLPEAEVFVFADQRALGQILDNLLSNAVKFSPHGKRVELVVQATAKIVECVVKDQGPGFSPQDHQRMFRRYGRLSARPTGDEPSTGLGLSIAKKLAQRINAELTCASLVGAGATFTVRLQAAMAPPVSEASPGAA